MDNANSQTVNVKIFNPDGQCVVSNVSPLSTYDTFKTDLIQFVNTLPNKKK